MSAVKAVQSGDLSTAIKNVNVAAKAIARAQHEVKITKTAVEIENRFTDISNQAINTASYHIARQISSGGYNQSFTQQQIQSAVSRAITRSTSGQVGEIVLEKLIETEVEGKMVISGKEILKITVKAVEEEINTITPQEILKDTKDIWSSSPFLDIGNCPFGCSSKPEVVSDKSISAINDSNLVMQIEKQDNDLRAIRISKILGEETTYIPIIIDKYTVENEKEILVIKIGKITEEYHGLTVKKIEIEINDTKKGAEIKLDVIPAIDIDEPLPIVIETPDNNYMPIYPSYVMTADEKKKLVNSWADNQEWGHLTPEYIEPGFDKFVNKTKTCISCYREEKLKAIEDGFVILEEGVSSDGDPYFVAGIAHGQKAEMIKISTQLEGDIPSANTDLQYGVKDTEQTRVNLSDIVSGDVNDYEFEVSGENARLLTTQISGDELVLIPTNPEKTYGTDYINVLVTDKTTGKTALAKVFIVKGESNTIENPSETFDATVNGEKADKIVVHFEEDFDIKLGDQLYIDGYIVKSIDDMPMWGPQSDEIYVDENGHTTPFTPKGDTVTVTGNSASNIASVTVMQKPANSPNQLMGIITGNETYITASGPSGGGGEAGYSKIGEKMKKVAIEDGGYDSDDVFLSIRSTKSDVSSLISNLKTNVKEGDEVTLVFIDHGVELTDSGSAAWTDTGAVVGAIGLCLDGEGGCTSLEDPMFMDMEKGAITDEQIASYAKNFIYAGAEKVNIIIDACHAKNIGKFLDNNLGSYNITVTTLGGTESVQNKNMEQLPGEISDADGNLQEAAKENVLIDVVRNPNPGEKIDIFSKSDFIEEEPSTDPDKAYTGTGSLRVGTKPTGGVTIGG
jgi:hypothetical protein